MITLSFKRSNPAALRKRRMWYRKNKFRIKQQRKLNRLRNKGKILRRRRKYLVRPKKI